MKSGKKYTTKAKLVKPGNEYLIADAIKLLKQATFAKFDETIDLSIRLGIDPKKSDQNVRGTVVLPSGTGKKVKIAVITKGEKVKEALAAGADHAGSEDLIEKIMGGWMDFDMVLASPDMMAVAGKLGKVLGKIGLMPNPKAGTVAVDVAKAVKEFKGGKVEFKPDKAAIIHLGIGKVSFGEKEISDNLYAILDAISKAKPHGLKGQYIRSVYMSSTMGPGIKINYSKAIKETQE